MSASANFQCPNCKQKMRIGGLFLTKYASQQYEGSLNRKPLQCHGCSMMVYPEPIPAENPPTNQPVQVFTNGTTIVPRSGFTLIELLVTITIVTILMSLLLVAVQNVRESFRRTQAKDEIGQFGVAASFFKQKYGSHPLWFGSNIPPGQKFRLCTNYKDHRGEFLRDSNGQVWPEVSVLLQMWPNLNMNDNGLRLRGIPIPHDMAIELDPTQWFFFLLTGGEHCEFSGLCENQRQVFSPPQSPTEKRSQFLSINNSRKFWNMSAQEYDGYYRDPWDTPYVVHLSRYSFGPQRGTMATMDQMKNSFQIVSAGKDKKFSSDDDLYNWK